MENTPHNYLDSKQYCQDKTASLPTKEILADILKAKNLTVVAAWVGKTFKPVEPQTLGAWVKDDESNLKKNTHSGYNFKTGESWLELRDHDSDLLFTICQFNP